MGGYGSGRVAQHLHTTAYQQIDAGALHRQGRLRAWSITAGVAVTTTPCTYGGERYWFRCPQCGRRARILYAGPGANIRPACRVCLDLSYEDTRAKQRVYERYLLEHPNLMNSAIYDALPVHSLSPEEADRASSKGYSRTVERQLRFAFRLMRLVLSCIDDPAEREQVQAEVADLRGVMEQRGMRLDGEEGAA